MKKYSLLLFSLIASFLFTSELVIAEGAEQIFESSNQLYNKGKYAEAIIGYRKILANNECSGELYFNLANAYYKLDSIPQAILYYEKAKLLIPNDDDLYTNLKLANLKTTDKIEAIPQLFFLSWYQNFLQKFSTQVWAWLSIVACALSFLLFWFFVSSKKLRFKKLYFFSASIFLIACILLVVIASASNDVRNVHRAVVFTPSVTLKSEPNVSSTNLYVIHEGATCKIVERVNNWFRVKLDNGSEGWLTKSDVKEI